MLWAFLIPALATAHTLVKVNPASWPADAHHHRALGKNLFVVDDSVALLYSHAVVSSEPLQPIHKYDLKNFPSERGAVVRTAGKTSLDSIKIAAGTTKVFDVGNNRVSVTDPVSLDAAAKIANLPFVVCIHPRPVYQKFTLASQIAGFGSPDVLADYPAAAETVSLGDTGLDYQHCMFYDAAHAVTPATLPVNTALPVTDTAHSKIRAYLTVCLDAGCTDATDATDFVDGHGTHVAGILAGGWCPSDASSGFARDSKIVFFDLDSGVDPNSIELPANMNGIFATAVANGATSFSASFGGGAPGVYGDLSEQMDAFAHDNPAFVFVVAAGNSGDTVADPATLKNGISVGATMISAAAYLDGSRGFGAGNVASYPENYASTKIASFSSTGPSEHGRIAPIVCTPGVQVKSAESAGAGAIPGHFSEVLKTGTSMSAPNTPVANVRARLANITASSTVKSATIRAAIILNTAPSTGVIDWTHSAAVPTSIDPASREGFGTALYDSSFWYDPSKWIVREGTIATAESVTTCYTVTGTVTAALVWNDPPGAQIVNVLHLIANEASAVDVLNNHKRVSVSAVNLRVTVFAPSLIVGTQGYSVVIRSTAPIAAAVCSPSACSPYEPSVPCSLAHGTGVFECIAGVLSTTCTPSACASGYKFQGAACVVGTGTATCAAGAWNGTACACINSQVCSSIVLCGDTCVSSVATVPPTPTPDVSTLGISYWIGISFWIVGVVAFLAFLYLAERMGFASLTVLAGWNLLCGALVSNDCVSLCSTDGHFWGLLAIGILTMICCVLHCGSLHVDDEWLGVAVSAVVAFAFIVFFVSPQYCFVTAALAFLFILVFLYANNFALLIGVSVAVWAIAALAITSPPNAPGAFTFLFLVVVFGAALFIAYEFEKIPARMAEKQA